jgi:hypothetical protein
MRSGSGVLLNGEALDEDAVCAEKSEVWRYEHVSR